MARHVWLFVATSCLAPLIAWVHMGIRARSEPIKFDVSWVPFLLILWGLVSAACATAAAGVAYLLAGRRCVVGRSHLLTAAAGLAFGLWFTIYEDVPVHWSLAAVVVLGPVLFRARAAPHTSELDKSA